MAAKAGESGRRLLTPSPNVRKARRGRATSQRGELESRAQERAHITQQEERRRGGERRGQPGEAPESDGSAHGCTQIPESSHLSEADSLPVD